MIIVDASVMVSVFWIADVHHDESRSWLARYALSNETLAAPILILSEVAGAITRRTGDPALGHEAVQETKATPRLTLLAVNDEIGDLAAELAADLRLHGADATYVAVADHLGAPLLTWDNTQYERGKPRVMMRRPNEV